MTIRAFHARMIHDDPIDSLSRIELDTFSQPGAKLRTEFYIKSRIRLDPDLVEKRIASLAAYNARPASELSNKLDMFLNFMETKTPGNAKYGRHFMNIVMSAENIPQWQWVYQIDAAATNAPGAASRLNTTVGVPIGDDVELEWWLRYGNSSVGRCLFRANGAPVFDYSGETRGTVASYLEWVAMFKLYAGRDWYQGYGSANGPLDMWWSYAELWDGLPPSLGGDGTQLLYIPDFSVVSIGADAVTTSNDTFRSAGALGFDALRTDPQVLRHYIQTVTASRPTVEFAKVGVGSTDDDYVFGEMVDIEPTTSSNTGITLGAGGHVPDSGGGYTVDEQLSVATFTGSNNEAITHEYANAFDVGPPSGPKVLSATTSARPGVSNDYNAFRFDTVLAANQYSSAYNNLRSSTTAGSGPACCMSDNVESYYAAINYQAKFDLVLMLNGIPTILATTSAAAVNSKIEIGKIGNQIYVFDDGVIVPALSISDSTLSGGFGGCAFYNNSTNSSLINFACGNYLSASIGVEIEDAFAGTAGTSVDDRIPDVTDNGSTWLAILVDDVGPVLDGSGGVKFTAPDQGMLIDFGLLPIDATFVINQGGVHNHFAMRIAGDKTVPGNRTCIDVLGRSSASNFRIQNTVKGAVQLQQDKAYTFDTSADLSVRIRYEPDLESNPPIAHIRGAVGDTQVFAFDVPLESGLWLGVRALNLVDDTLRFKNFKVVRPEDVEWVTVENDIPVITSNSGAAIANIDVVENTVALPSVAATDNDDLTYIQTNGVDARHFTLNPTTGVYAFRRPHYIDFPDDGILDDSGNPTGKDNVYEDIVGAQDVFGATATQVINARIVAAQPAFLAQPSVTDITASSMTISALTRAGTVYVVLDPDDLDPYQVILGTSSSDGTADFADNKTSDGSTPVEFNLTGLVGPIVKGMLVAAGNDGSFSYYQISVQLSGAVLPSGTFGPLENGSGTILADETIYIYRCPQGGSITISPSGAANDPNAEAVTVDSDGLCTITGPTAGNFEVYWENASATAFGYDTVTLA